jgi:hypothetical protein
MERQELLLYAFDFCVHPYSFVTERKALKDVYFMHDGKKRVVALRPHMLKHIKDSWSHYTDPSELVAG